MCVWAISKVVKIERKPGCKNQVFGRNQSFERLSNYTYFMFRGVFFLVLQLQDWRPDFLMKQVTSCTQLLYYLARLTRPNFSHPSSHIALVYQSFCSRLSVVLLSYESRLTLIRLERRIFFVE